MPKPPTEPLSIVLDDRELRSKAARHLFSMGVKLESRRLGIADFIIAESVFVERKTAADFESSIIDGRLFAQARELSKLPAPVIAVVGSDFSRLSSKAIIGAMVSLATDFRIPVFRFASEEELAEFLAVTATQKAKAPKPLALRYEKPNLTLADRQQFVVESLPMVGPAGAKSLLRKLGSVGAVIGASEEQLQSADGVGPVRAKEIRRVVESKFEG
ncbi:MAG: ERCC4 domain-containing protein [Candidatus Micrarchaeota archaeon]